VRAEFGIPAPRQLGAAFFGRLSYANVVRFDGRARWHPTPFARTTVTCTEMEIVRTDRVLSAEGTVVLARVALTPGGD
jgi:hypothetical protein